jgi:zinc transporter 2
MFMIVEIIGGIMSGSLAILTDAAHLLSDLAGFAISIVALVIGARAPTNSLTFGYHRAETVGALASVILIWALTIWLIYEAILRIINPPDVEGKLMLIVAVLGLCANMIMMWMLKDSTTSSHGDHGDGEGHDGSGSEDGGHEEGEGHGGHGGNVVVKKERS